MLTRVRCDRVHRACSSRAGRCGARLAGYGHQVIQGLLDAIRSVPPLLAYALIALLVFGEAAVFVGFVFPGETAVLFGGFLASQGHLDIVTLTLLVVVCAIVG